MTTATFSPSRKSDAHLYLFHPVIDLFMVCGGWLFFLAALNYGFTSGAGNSGEIYPPLQAAILIGTYLLAQPHSAATLFKLYGDKKTRNSHEVIAYLVPGLLIMAFFAALAQPQLARLEATLYIALAIHHIMAQSYGIALMYCNRAKLNLSELERLLLKIVLWTAVAGAVTQQLSAQFSRHSLLGVTLYQFELIPEAVVFAFQIVAALTMAALIAVQMRRKLSGQETMPLPAVLTMLTTLLLMTIWNSGGEFVWLFVPAFFHGSQYLCVTMAYFIKKELGTVTDKNGAALAEFIAIRFTQLFLVALGLFVLIPKIISDFGAPFSLCSALMFFSISLHHFAADAHIWKMRNPEVRKSLISD